MKASKWLVGAGALSIGVEVSGDGLGVGVGGAGGGFGIVGCGRERMADVALFVAGARPALPRPPPLPLRPPPLPRFDCSASIGV